MLVRVSRAAIAASLLALPHAASAQAFEYGPGTAQYRVTQKTKLAQEMMGQKQEAETSTLQLFTMALTRPSKDTVAVTYTIDSIAATTPMGTPAPFTDRFKGMKVEVKAAPTGSVAYSVKGPTEAEVPNASPIVTGLGGFLPKLRPTMSRGTKWTDTTAGKVSQLGIDLDRKVISRNEVVKDTTVNGVMAWKIQRSDSATVSGSGTGQSGPMTMEGSSLANTTLYVTPKGLILGGDGTENGSIRIVLSSNGMEVNITTASETKVEKVK